jgi:Domain of unknown function (DUF5658)
LAVTNAIKSTRPIDKVGLNVLGQRERLDRLKVLNTRSTFAILQVLDLLTTLAAFRVGAYEVNPIVAHLTVLFGRFSGVLISKVIALLLALGVRKRLWIVNLFYLGVIYWNVTVLWALCRGR